MISFLIVVILVSSY